MSNLPQNSGTVKFELMIEKGHVFVVMNILCIGSVTYTHTHTHILQVLRIDGNAKFTFYLFIRLIKKPDFFLVKL